MIDVVRNGSKSDVKKAQIGVAKWLHVWNLDVGPIFLRGRVTSEGDKDELMRLVRERNQDNISFPRPTTFVE